MSDAIYERLRAALGESAVTREGNGCPAAHPDTTKGVARACRMAHEEGWRIRIEGRGTWLPLDAPCDMVLRLRALGRVVSVSPEDLVTTVEAGAPLDAVGHRLADRGMWLALDPPGRPDRSLGSIVATATAGPSRLGFGSIRDHVLGCTVVTGDGRIIRAGGRVVKNVAGYDLTRLQVGAFGGFGVITELHCRLRVLPRADRTLLARGQRDTLLALARDVIEAGLSPAALELLSPAIAAEADWVLAARFQGGVGAVGDDIRAIPGAAAIAWDALPPERSSAFWALVARAMAGGTVTIRLAALADGLYDLLDLIAHDLDEDLLSAGCGDGTVRWTGTAPPERIIALRHAAAAREIPLTLERADWDVRSAVGHFGAYRENVGGIVERLRASFDPGGRFSVALGAGES